uniref:Protein kinase domain-containing protein n=1 Tax=Caenorhabditis japonica TaxID=281687 RepID=A0A8R1E779_CAEJA
MNILLFPGTPTHGRRSSNIFKLCDMGCSKALSNDSSQEMRTLVGTANFLVMLLFTRYQNTPKMREKLGECSDWPETL